MLYCTFSHNQQEKKPGLDGLGVEIYKDISVAK